MRFYYLELEDLSLKCFRIYLENSLKFAIERGKAPLLLKITTVILKGETFSPRKKNEFFF